MCQCDQVPLKNSILNFEYHYKVRQGSHNQISAFSLFTPKLPLPFLTLLHLSQASLLHFSSDTSSPITSSLPLADNDNIPRLPFLIHTTSYHSRAPPQRFVHPFRPCSKVSTHSCKRCKFCLHRRPRILCIRRHHKIRIREWTIFYPTSVHDRPLSFMEQAILFSRN